MVIQARLRIRHIGCTSEQVVGGARIIHMSGDDTHCISVFRATSREHLHDLLAGNRGVLEPHGLIEATSRWAVARCHCPREGTRILPIIQRHDCAVIWPVIESEGHEFYTILAPSRKRVAGLMADLKQEGEVHVERISRIPGPALDVSINLSDVTQTMTKRQLNVLKMAVVSGYYELPRQVYAEELAKGAGMSRSTFQEHLQKAEAAVMRTFVDLVLDHPALEEQATKGRGRPKNGLKEWIP